MANGHRYIFTGGGLAGHVRPNLAIAAQIRKKEPETRFLYVGIAGGAEADLTQKHGMEFQTVKARPFPGFLKPRSPLFYLALLMGMVKSLFILWSFKPNIIVSSGGYIAAPLLFAALVLRKLHCSNVKLLVIETNAIPGKLNQAVAGAVDRVGVSFPEALDCFSTVKPVYLGHPVLDSGESEGRDAARESLGIPTGARLVLAFGGTSSVRTINRALVDALPALLEQSDVHVVLSTGARRQGGAYNGEQDVKERLAELKLPDQLLQRFQAHKNLPTLSPYLRAADLVICRAGSSSIAELSRHGVPSLLIPRANVAGDHQVINARAMEREGAARLIYERPDLSSGDRTPVVFGKRLAAEVLALLDDGQALKEMSDRAIACQDPYVAQRIAHTLASLLGEETGAERLPEPHLTAVPERIAGKNSNALVALLKMVISGGEEPLSDDDRELVRYKADTYLVSTNYEVRARGCRIAGLLGYRERLEILLAKATGQDSPGKYSELPIVRRDAIVGLGHMGICSEDVYQALEAGLDDEYFESRFKAAWALGVLVPQGSIDPARRGRIEQRLRQLTRTFFFEIRKEAVVALAEVLQLGTTEPDLFKHLYYHPVWPIRDAVVKALHRLLDRGVLTADQVELEMEQVLVTSNGFTTQYGLKSSLSALGGKLDTATRKEQAAR